MHSTWAAGLSSRSTRVGQCHVADSAEGPRRVRGTVSVPRVVAGHVSVDGSPSNAQAVLDRYQTLLREYRLHKQSLGDWFTGVLRQQRRQPQLLDAQATGDEALVARFQQYLMVRKRLLAEIPLMREQLEEATQHDTLHHSNSSSGKHHKHKPGVNANQTTPVNKSQAVGQFFAAVNYRKQQGTVRHAAAAAAEAQTPEVAQAAAAVTALVSQHARAAAAAAAPNTVAAAAPGAVAAAGQLSIVGAAPASASDVVPALSNPQQLGMPQIQQQSGKAEGAVSHILSAAMNSGSSAPAASGRAAAAALAALAYKKRQQGGSSAASDNTDSSSSSRAQRPLAIQMAAAPEPPPGYKPGAAADSSEQQQAAAGAGPMVERGQMDVVYARAPRRALDNDLSLEATLQGVPGGLGGDFNATLFAATTVLAGDATTLMSPGSSGSSSGVETAPEAPQQPQQQQQVGHVVTAKFDVYSGRRRKLESSQLDEFLAGLSEAYSATPAAAAAATLPAAAANTAMASGTAATAAAAAASGPSAAEGAAVITTTTKGSSSSSGRSTGPVQSSASKGQSAMEKALAYKQQQQLGVKHASAKGTGGDSSNSSGMLPPDIIPMAT